MKYLINIISDFLSTFNTETHCQSDDWINLGEDKREEIIKKIKNGITEDDDFICIIN